MFGDVWPIGRWAGLGATVGAMFQAVQIIGQGAGASWSYNSGRIVGGLLLGAVVGALTAVIRNALLAGKQG